jgi:hypothetical protein
LKENNGTLPLLQKAYHELFIALEVNNNLTSQAMEILPQIKKFYANTGEYKLTEIQAMLVKEAIEKDYGIFLHLLENYIEDGLGISAQPGVGVPVKAFAPAAAPAPVVIDQANEMIKKKAADIIFNNIATLYKDDKNLCKETGLMKVGQDNAHSYENVSSFMVALASNKLIEFQGQEDKQKVEDFFKSLSPQELTSLVAQQLKKMIEGE